METFPTQSPENLPRPPAEELARLKTERDSILNGLGGGDYMPGGDPRVNELNRNITALEINLGIRPNPNPAPEKAPPAPKPYVKTEADLASDQHFRELRERIINKYKEKGM